MGCSSSQHALHKTQTANESTDNWEQFRVEVDEFSDVVDLAGGGQVWRGSPLVRQLPGGQGDSVMNMIKRSSLFASTRFMGPRTTVGMVAAGLVRRLMTLVDAVDNEVEDVPDHLWSGLPDCDGNVFNWLLKGKDVLAYSAFESKEDFVCKLCHAAAEIMQSQPTLVELRAPVKIFGDIHGQLRDLLLFFNEYGKPTVGRGGDIELVSYVFNGDWVDRGKHQVEVMIALLCLKVTYPERIWLIRGNHEDECMNLDMGEVGFKVACERAFASEEALRVFAYFQVVFSFLPLAATVESKVLVVHGGIGDGQWRLEYLRNVVKRPLQSHQIQRDRIVRNLLWSDPVPEDRDGEDASTTFGVHTSPRNSSIKSFGADVTLRFCELNALDMIVRSHQCTKHGYGYTLMHGGRLMRVFSARHYDNIMGNAAAVLLLGYKRPREQGDTARGLVIRAKVIRPPPQSQTFKGFKVPSCYDVTRASFDASPREDKQAAPLTFVEVDEECDVVNKSIDKMHCHGHALQVWECAEGSQGLHRAAVVGQPVLCGDRFHTAAGKMGEMAGALVERAMELVELAGAEPGDVHSNDWKGPAAINGDLTHWLFKPILETFHSVEEGVMAMCASARELLLRQGSMVELRAPVKIFGSFQGQLRDMLMFFNQFGRPTVGRGGDIEIISYVFNGGWVGGGKHQVELTVVLFALKLIYGERVWLLRGVPEAKPPDAADETGFLAACKSSFRRGLGERVHDAFMDAFACLPVAATVENRVLIVHGGIGNGHWNMDDLRKCTSRAWRTSEILADPLRLELLWSKASMSKQISVSSTGATGFNKTTTLAFCERNSLGLIVSSRAGSLSEGYVLMHAGRLMHVVSGRGFGDNRANSGAMVVAAYKRLRTTGDRGIILRAKVLKAAVKDNRAAEGSALWRSCCMLGVRRSALQLRSRCVDFLCCAGRERTTSVGASSASTLSSPTSCGTKSTFLSPTPRSTPLSSPKRSKLP